MQRRWRRLDEPGLEVMELRHEGDRIVASSCLTFGGAPSFGARYTWVLDAAWRTRTLRLDVIGATDKSIMFERAGAARWRVDGVERPDLDLCDELDVSATPFCNALAIRRLGEKDGEITALYVRLPDLAIRPSRQRYEQRGARRWRYIDLGVAKGFEADLELDDQGLVQNYEGLFEAF